MRLFPGCIKSIHDLINQYVQCYESFDLQADDQMDILEAETDNANLRLSLNGNCLDTQEVNTSNFISLDESLKDIANIVISFTYFWLSGLLSVGAWKVRMCSSTIE